MIKKFKFFFIQDFATLLDHRLELGLGLICTLFFALTLVLTEVAREPRTFISLIWCAMPCASLILPNTQASNTQNHSEGDLSLWASLQKSVFYRFLSRFCILEFLFLLLLMIPAGLCSLLYNVSLHIVASTFGVQAIVSAIFSTLSSFISTSLPRTFIHPFTLSLLTCPWLFGALYLGIEITRKLFIGESVFYLCSILILTFILTFLLATLFVAQRE